MKNLLLYFTIFLQLATLSSCVSSKKIVYFNDLEKEALSQKIASYEPKIKVGDIIAINISAVEPEASIPFNLYASPPMQGNATPAETLDYLVNADGTILMPIFGKVSVVGLTTIQVTRLIESKLADYIEKPSVYVRLKNFKVIVLGEVNSPGFQIVENERITILEAIALAGDLSINGKRKNVTLIREENGKRTFTKIDLTKKSLFDSEYFYLAQNDVIYVEPNKRVINSSSAVAPGLGIFLSTLSTVLAIFAILAN